MLQDRPPIPAFAVIEDSPQRLVLQASGARLIPAVVFLGFALIGMFGWWMEREWWWMLVIAGAFGTGAAFLVLYRPRWTIDQLRRP